MELERTLCDELYEARRRSPCARESWLPWLHKYISDQVGRGYVHTYLSIDVLPHKLALCDQQTLIADMKEELDGNGIPSEYYPEDEIIECDYNLGPGMIKRYKKENLEVDLLTRNRIDKSAFAKQLTGTEKRIRTAFDYQPALERARNVLMRGSKARARSRWISNRLISHNAPAVVHDEFLIRFEQMMKDEDIECVCNLRGCEVKLPLTPSQNRTQSRTGNRNRSRSGNRTPD